MNNILVNLVSSAKIKHYEDYKTYCDFYIGINFFNIRIVLPSPLTNLWLAAMKFYEWSQKAKEHLERLWREKELKELTVYLATIVLLMRIYL